MCRACSTNGGEEITEPRRVSRQIISKEKLTGRPIMLLKNTCSVGGRKAQSLIFMMTTKTKTKTKT
jgi:hypothetical protein